MWGLDPRTILAHSRRVASVDKSTSPGRRRWLRWVAGLGVVGLLYTALGFWAAPALIRSQLIARVPEHLGRVAEVGSIRVNPFRLTLTISNLLIRETNGPRLLSLERFHADLQAASLWRRALVLREVELIGPVVELQRQADGRLSIADLFSMGAGSPASTSGPPAVELARLEVRGGEVVLRDEAIPGGYSKRLSGVDVWFTNLTTRLDQRFPGTLKVVGDTGERLTWEGDLGVNPVGSRGEVRIERFPLPPQRVYWALAMAADVAEGAVSVGFDYALTERDSQWAVDLTEGYVRLTNFGFNLPQATTPTLILAQLDVEKVEASLGERWVRVGEVAVRDGRFSAKRGSDGSVDVAQAIRPEFVERLVQEFHDWFDGWKIEVPSVLGERLELRWGDEDLREITTPVSVVAQVDQIRLQGLSNQSNQPVNLELRGQSTTRGQLTVQADATLLPAAATVKAQFQNVKLANVQPYIGSFLNLQVDRGELDGQWTVHYNRPAGGPLITAEGRLAVRDFLAVETQAGRDFLKWQELDVHNVQASWEPARIHIEEIRLREPATSFVLMTNGQLNVQALVKSTPSGAPSPATVIPVTVEVDRLTFTNASLYAGDQTVPGQFSTTLERFSGFVSEIAWPNYRKSQVELAGYVGARAPFSVSGTILPDPARMFLDMHVTTTNAELLPFTPYMIKFAGYPLREGRVTADVRYRVDGQQVVGENMILIDRLTLGPRSEGRPLLDLPIKLGIAILKDRNGRITLDIPVKGSLNDPEFGVGKVVWQAVKGLFVKVATAPFRLLGSLFGGSEEEGQALQYVEFAAGTSQLPVSATNQLERLVSALNQRPELYLVLRGGVAAKDDGQALAQERISGELRRLRQGELNNLAGTAPATPPAEGVSLDEADRVRLLGQLFTNTFPVVVAPTNSPPVELAAPLEVAAPVAPVAPGIMQQRLLEHFQPGPADLEALRAARVAAVRSWLLGSNRLAAERLVGPAPGATNDAALPQRVVEFSLE